MKPFSTALRLRRWLCLDKVMLWHYFEQSAILPVTVHWVSAVCQLRQVNFLKLSGVKPSYGASATPDCHIPELMKFQKVMLCRRKIVRKSLMIRQNHVTKRLAADNHFMLLFWWCPFKIQKEKRTCLQFTSTDFLSIVLTPLRIRWTILWSEGPEQATLCPLLNYYKFTDIWVLWWAWSSLM